MAENICVCFISNGAGSEGVGLYPFPLPGICEHFAKQMSLLQDRARTHDRRGRYQQLLLTCFPNGIILLEALKEQGQSPLPRTQLRSSISRSPAARFQTHCFDTPQRFISLTQPLYNPVKLSPATVQTLYSLRRGSVQDLSQLQSTSE